MKVTDYAKTIIDEGSCYSGAEVLYILAVYEKQEAERKEKEAKLEMLRKKMSAVIDKEAIEWRQSTNI